MTDRERLGLRGAVWSCDVADTTYTRQCGADACVTEPRTHSTRTEFRADGAFERVWQRISDGREFSTNYEYDAAGHLAMMRLEDTGGVSGYRSFEYDPTGRVSRVLVRERDTAEWVQETYEYGAAGRKAKTIHVDLSAQIPNMNYVWGVENTDAGYAAPGAATVTTTYDYNDHPTALLFHDAAGLPLSRVEFRYDTAGNLIEEEQITEELGPPLEMAAQLNSTQLAAIREMLAKPRRLHRYDNQDRRIETVTSMGVLSEDRKAIAYNEYGDVAEEVSEEERQEYGMDAEGRLFDNPERKKASRSECRFRHEYDTRGNWIEKTSESRSGQDKEFTVFRVERRTLIYY